LLTPIIQEYHNIQSGIQRPGILQQL